jgi:sialidase-1
MTLFEAGSAGYKGFRIPALVMTTKGTLLAFCAARKELGDWADIDIAMRRSTDGGKTWSPMKIIAERGTMTVDNWREPRPPSESEYDLGRRKGESDEPKPAHGSADDRRAEGN